MDSFDFDALLRQHTKKHKIKPVQFTSVAGGVQNRLEKNIKYRKSNRLSVFDSLRNLSKHESPEPKVSNGSQKLEHRKQQLEKWKQEKEKKKKEAAKTKKKPFIAGVAHASLKYQPPPPLPTKAVPSTSGRVTRSQSSKNKKDTKNLKLNDKPSFAPENATFKPPKSLSKYPTLAPVTKKNNNKANMTISFDPVLPKKAQKVNANKTISTLPTIAETLPKPVAKKPIVMETRRTTRSRAAANLTSKNEVIPQKKVAVKVQAPSSSSDDTSSTEKSPVFKVRTPRKSTQRSNNSTPKNPVPKSESSSEEKLRSPRSEEPMTPEQISEESQTISPCVTLSRGKSNARKEMKQKIEEGLLDLDAVTESVAHFRRQLSSETERILARCDAWDDLLHAAALPEHAQESILSGVGQARLLVAQKFQQFAGLVARCGGDAPGAAVTPADLAGFWDMLFIQVENVDLRFKQLEQLRARNWRPLDDDVIRKVKPAVVVKKVNKPSAATSRMREIIAAARKAKKDLEAARQQDSKTFEAGFFTVQSPVRSSSSNSPRSTPNRNSLLKAVLSSEAKKATASRNSASLAMLRASLICKTMDDELSPVSNLTPVDLFATPARSILKSNKKQPTESKKSGKKSIKVVLFDDSDYDLQNTSGSDLNTSSNKEQNATAKFTEKENDETIPVVKSKLMRQDAMDDRSPVLTRSRRKSMQNTPTVNKDGDFKVNIEAETPRRSSRKKVLQELQDNSIQEKVTPKRSSRRRKSASVV